MSPRTRTPARSAQPTESPPTLETLIRGKAEMFVRFGTKECERWQARFAAEPAAALEWSRTIFTAAAKLSVGKFWLEHLTPDRDLPALIKRQVSEVFDKARWPERSTSPVSDLMSQEMNAARADFLSDYITGVS